LIPSGSTPINDVFHVVLEDEQWFYFCGIHPIFCHGASDRRSFRMFTAQLVCQGMCKQAEIVRAFGVSKNSVGRSVKKFREGGPDAFFDRRKGRGGSVITEEVKARAQEMLNSGESRQDVAEALGVPYDTLRKAINQGRLTAPPKAEKRRPSDKSTRTAQDASAEMGTACTRPIERVAAAFGLLPGGASTQFEPCRAVIRDLCRAAVDLVPDNDAGVLEIRVHALANPRSDHAIEHLLAHLNETELNYPGTNLRLSFSMVAPRLPPPGD
jgi:transposase